MSDKWGIFNIGTASGYGKVPSQQLSDAMVEAFKDKLKTDD